MTLSRRTLTSSQHSAIADSAGQWRILLETGGNLVRMEPAVTEDV